MARNAIRWRTYCPWFCSTPAIGFLRQGLLREYRFEEQEVDGVRGKLNLAETLKSSKHLNDRTIYQVDELTQDVVINRLSFYLEETDEDRGY